jgi:hypothetical protein
MTDIDFSRRPRAEKGGAGTWVERAGEFRRRFAVDAHGQRVLPRQQQIWNEFVEAVRPVTRGEHA